MLTLLRRWRYELVAFLTGMSVMVLEIVGARLIAPFFGTSIYVWTAMIGVILGALAVGYAVGGRLADKYAADRSLTIIILAAAFLVTLLGFVQQPVLDALAQLGLDERLSALLAAVLLFGAPSVLIGAVSPHLAKLRILSLTTSGQSVGRLEAAGALGSISGTFACGYLLLGLFGSRSIVFGVAALLVVTSLLSARRRYAGVRAGLVAVAVAGGLLTSITDAPDVLADIDTSYARYQVRQLDYGEPITALQTDYSGIQSGVPTDGSGGLVFAYTQGFARILATRSDVESILVIGGGTFTFPQYAARQNPGMNVDAVELDPALTGVAQRYFELRERSNLRIINQDGRTYLNRTDTRYNVIYLDAYNSLSPPFQLTTVETMQQAARSLQTDGLLVANVIGDADSYNDRYLQAMAATAGKVFPHVRLLPAEPGSGNYLLIAGRQEPVVEQAERAISTGSRTLRDDGQILRDDFAPIEQLTRR